MEEMADALRITLMMNGDNDSNFFFFGGFSYFELFLEVFSEPENVSSESYDFRFYSSRRSEPS